MTAARYCSGMAWVRAVTWLISGIAGRVALSVPPPFTRHGFFSIKSSEMAVLKMALSSR